MRDVKSSYSSFVGVASRWVKISIVGLLLSSCVASVQEPTADSESLLIYSSSENPLDRLETFDFGTAAVGGYYEKQIYVINAGKTNSFNIRDVTIAGQAFAYKGGAYPGVGGTCATELTEGQSCSIVLRFSPTSTDAVTGEIALSFEDKVSGVKESKLTTLGKGGTPALLSVSDGPTYDFGIWPLGASSDYTFTVQNLGEAAAVNVIETSLTGDFRIKDGVFPGTGGTCTAELLGGASCSIVVTFSPTTVGPITDNINLFYFDGVNNQNAVRAVQGEGVLPAVLEVSDSPIYSFGTVIVGQSPSYVLTITNTGGLPATGIFVGGLAVPYTFTGGSYPGTLGTCGASLLPSLSCTVDITFTPTAAGVWTDTLDVVYNNGVQLTTTDRDLTANAVMPAFIEISDAPLYNYGTVAVGSINSHSFTLTNTGGVAATLLNGTGLAAPFLFPGGVYPGAGGTCGFILNAGASCSVVVGYEPVGPGVITDTLNIDYNNGLGLVASLRDVQGNALPPANLVISDADPYDYGSIALGASATHVFTISNTGSVAATSVNITGLGSPFLFVGGAFPGTAGTCTTTIIAGSSCTVEISFTPVATGIVVSTINLNYNNGAITVATPKDLQGEGVAPAVLSISENPLYDFGTAVIGTTVTHAFTISNSGGIDATTISGLGLAPPFAFAGGAYPGVGGTCGVTLAASAGCSIVVAYSPISLTTDTDTIQINYFDGAVNQSVYRDVTGQGIPPGLLSISDSPLFNFGTIAVNSTRTFALTVSNIGGATTTAMSGGGLAAPFAYFGGAYPGTGGTCGLSLAPGTDCTVVVEFAPTVINSYVDTVEIDYDNGIGLQVSTRDIQGSGAAPALLGINLGPTFNFAQRALASTTDQVFIVTNSGGVDATGMTGVGLAAPYVYSGGSYPGTGGTCGASLAPTLTCTISVSFTPTVVGIFNDTVQLDYDNGVLVVSADRDVVGEGVNPGLLTITEADPYDFGPRTVGSVTSHVFDISNVGDFPATAVIESSLAAPFTFLGGTFPGTGGTCTVSIANGTTCSVVIAYSPTATGLLSGAMQFDYNNGATSQSVIRTLQGTGISPATLTLSSGPIYDFLLQPVGISIQGTLTLSNTGGSPATVIAGSGLAAPFDFLGGSFPGTGGTCTATLAAGASCTLVVDYQPTAPGALTDTVIISYYDGANNQTVDRDVTGTAATPAQLTITESDPYSYGIQATGSVTPHTFTVTNTGGVTATGVTESALAGVFQFAGGAFPGTGGTCLATLAAGASCDLVIAFSPLVNGLQNGSLQIDYNNGVVAQSAIRTLNGTGADPALLTVSDSPVYNFGLQGTGSQTTHIFTVNNTGGVPATAISASGLATPYTFLGGAFPGTGGTCTTTLAAGAACTFVVEFAPVTTGVLPDTFTLDYQDGAGAQSVSGDVTGTGAAPALLTVFEAPLYDYFTTAVGSVTDHAFTITNSGGVTATAMTGGAFTTNFTFAGGTYPGTGGTCGATLAATTSCTVVVSFTPTVSSALTDTLAVGYNNGISLQTATTAIQGTGAAPALLTLSPGATINYGNIPVNGTSVSVITVTNTGGVDATGVGGSGLAAPFDFTGGSFPGTGGTCAGTLAPLASCTITVEFAPTVVNSYSDTVVVDYNNGAFVTSVSRNLTGNGAAPAELTISDNPLYDFGNVVLTATASRILTVTNTGGVDATLIAGAGLGAPYDYAGGAYPGTSGTCGVTLAPTVSCTVEVIFTPSGLGVAADTMELNFNDGVVGQVSSRNLTGTGVNPAVLAIDLGPTFDYLTQATGSVTSQTFVVSNTGGAPATGLIGGGLAGAFSFAGGTYPGTAGTCGPVIANGSSCNIVVNFAPTVTGLQTSTIQLTYNDGANVQMVPRPVQGTAVNPALLTVGAGLIYDFGSLPVGSTTTTSLNINNSGGFDATGVTGSGLGVPFTFVGGAYPGAGGTCTGTIAAGATCTIFVSYSPVATGTLTDTIVIDYNDGAAAQSSTHDLQGTGVPPAILEISEGPGTYDYGIQATTSITDHTFIVSNTGGFIASVVSGSGLAAPFDFAGGSYPGAGGTCGANILPSTTCTVVVRYSPTVNGTLSDTLQIDYNNGFTTQAATRGVIGTGANPALLVIDSGPTHDYGTVATLATLDHVFVVDNTGGVPATGITEVGLAAPYSFVGGTFPGTGGTCTATLLQGTSCTLNVRFAPTVTGIQADALQLNYNDGAAATSSTRALTGNGASPAVITISGVDPVNFGTLANGSSIDITFTLQNTGGVPATTLTGSGLVAPFTFAGGSFPGGAGTCTATLAPAATCTTVVRFAPTLTGAYPDTIDITYNDGVAPQTTSRNVIGTGAAPALLSLSDGPLFNFGLVANGGTTSHVFTVSNSGDVAATAIAEIGMAGPFAFLGGSYPGTGGTCGLSLGASASCLIAVEFAPLGIGPFASSIELSYDNGAIVTSVIRNIQGTGGAPASLDISNGPTYSYGTQATGSSTDFTFTVNNTGAVPATTMTGLGLAPPYQFKNGTYPGTGGTCGAILAAAATCTLVVTYEPTVVGIHNDDIQIDYNNGAAVVSSTRAVTGTGAVPALLTIDNAPFYDYGNVTVGATVTQTLTVNNSGGVAATAIADDGVLSAPFRYLGGTFPGTGGTCTPSLSAGSSCTLRVEYAPVASGAHSSTVDLVYYDGASTQNTVRPIQGNGLGPAVILVVGIDPYNFGTVPTGSVNTQTITLTNTGGTTASAMGGSGLVFPYNFVGGSYPGTAGTCAATLAPATSCTIVVSYTPAVPSVGDNDAIVIDYNDGAFAQSVTRNLTGVAVLPATLTISEANPYNFGTLALGASVNHTFTITNTGSFGATAMAETAVAAPFTYFGGVYPGTGGTCSTTLAAAATCTIVVQYSPAAPVVSNGSISFDYNDGVNPQTVVRTIQGTGANPANLTLSEADPYNFGLRAVGSATAHTFTLNNAGGFTASAISEIGLALPFRFVGGSFPGTAGTCTATLTSTSTVLLWWNLFLQEQDFSLIL